MIKLTAKQAKRVKGIIVWDFDRVLFDTDRFYRGVEKIFKICGISAADFERAVLQVRREKMGFSTSRALRILRAMGLIIPEKRIRNEIREHLLETDYYASSTDAILHRLQGRHLVNVILSHGSPAYVHSRIRVGLGAKFTSNFVRICATQRPKHLFFKKLVRRYPDLLVFFVDDIRDNIKLIKKYVPSVITIHYAENWSLKKVEKAILRYVRKEK